MSTPPAIQDDGGGTLSAGPTTGYSVPSVSQDQVLGLAPPSAKRRFNDVGRLGAQHAQVGFRNQHALENQPTPDGYTPYPWSSPSPATLPAQYQAAVPADMVPGPSSFTRRESVVSLPSEESFQPSSSSSLQEGLDGDATLSPRHTALGVPSHFADHILPEQDTSSAAPEVSRKRRRGVQRKRDPNPKDPKAADRLRNQRKTDDELIDLLFNRCVPSSVGPVAKKDRLPLSAFQSCAFPAR